MVSFGDLQTEAPLFFRPGISHVNLLSGEVAFEMQKGLDDTPSPPLPHPHESPSSSSPLQIHNALFTVQKTLKVFNSTTSQPPQQPPFFFSFISFVYNP